MVWASVAQCLWKAGMAMNWDSDVLLKRTRPPRTPGRRPRPAAPQRCGPPVSPVICCDARTLLTKTTRLPTRLQLVRQLPAADQRAVLKLVAALV